MYDEVIKEALKQVRRERKKKIKRKMSDVWWDSHITRHGINPLTYYMAHIGHKPSQDAIDRYEAAKARYEARHK